MRGVAPAGGVIHAGGSEGTVNAELVLAGLDVIGASLQLVEGVDVLGLVAGLLEELLVVDDAVALLNPVDTQILAVGLQRQESSMSSPRSLVSERSAQ